MRDFVICENCGTVCDETYEYTCCKNPKKTAYSPIDMNVSHLSQMKLEEAVDILRWIVEMMESSEDDCNMDGVPHSDYLDALCFVKTYDVVSSQEENEEERD